MHQEIYKHTEVIILVWGSHPAVRRGGVLARATGKANVLALYSPPP